MKPTFASAIPLLVLMLSPTVAAAAGPGAATALRLALQSAPQEIMVTAPKNARVIATYPTEGGVVPGGSAVLKIVFDQPMTADAWAYTPAAKGRFPDCLAQPRLLGDRRTFVLLCSLAVDTDYALSINADPTFETTAGRKPPPYTLSFRTGPATGEAGLHNALVAAGLSDADDPIQGVTAAPGAVKSPSIKQ